MKKQTITLPVPKPMTDFFQIFKQFGKVEYDWGFSSIIVTVKSTPDLNSLAEAFNQAEEKARKITENPDLYVPRPTLLTDQESENVEIEVDYAYTTWFDTVSQYGHLTIADDLNTVTVDLEDQTEDAVIENLKTDLEKVEKAMPYDGEPLNKSDYILTN